MGQYWYCVNLDKHEFIHPHRLGCGLKLWEILANQPSVGSALTILCAAMPQARGGGDLDLIENWHGPERTFPEYNTSPGPMPDRYQEVARATIGRWAGHRIALVGDYAENGDLPPQYEASEIYGRCVAGWWPDTPLTPEIAERRLDGMTVHDMANLYADVSDMVCIVIEHELHGRFYSEDGKPDGYRYYVEQGEGQGADIRHLQGMKPVEWVLPSRLTRPEYNGRGGEVYEATDEET